MADAVVAAKKGQKTPDGFYNVERVLRKVILGGGEALLCGTCMDARGMTAEDVMESAARGTMDALIRGNHGSRQGIWFFEISWRFATLGAITERPEHDLLLGMAGGATGAGHWLR